MRRPSYRHSQALWALWWLAPFTAAAGLVMLWRAGTDLGWAAALIVATHGVLLLVLGRLTIELDADHIRWHFGFIGWPRWQLPWHQVRDASATRTHWTEGWGIHRSRAGWLYNASGANAVQLSLVDGRCLRLGSDDVERLLGFIRARLPKR